VRKSSSLSVAVFAAVLVLGNRLDGVGRLPNYTITELGTLGGTESFAYAINNRGDIVGSSRLIGDSFTHGFLFGFGSMMDLNPLNSGLVQTVGPTGINNRGEIASGLIRGGVYAAAVYNSRNGEINVLGSFGGLAFGSFSGTATAINDSGHAVGYSYIDDLNRHAFLYKSGQMTDIGSLGGYSAALSINNADDVVGFSSASVNGSAHPFLYRQGVMSQINPFDQPSGEGIAWKVNNGGAVVGEALNGPYINGFVYFKGLVTNVGTLDGGHNSHAYSINDGRDVVGVADAPYQDVCFDYETLQPVQCVNFSYQGFLFKDGVMTDLRDLVGRNSGWDALYAFDINNRGQITGYGLRSGRFRAFVLTPNPER